MPPADRELAPPGQSADLVVVGGGVVGCWMALKAARAGLSILLVERQRIGAGASGGFLGALMPHMPGRWDDKKQFQFDALLSLKGEVARLEEGTGQTIGYARAGRLMPLSAERQRQAASGRAEAASEAWQGRFAYEICGSGAAPGWLDEAAAPAGAVRDTLSARLSPMGLMAALEAALSREPRVTVLAGEASGDIDVNGGSIRLTDGARLAFGHLAVANGTGAFPLLEACLGRLSGTLGGPVKGQAALLQVGKLPAAPDTLPLLYEDGVYVIAHGDGSVAVGSTSETEFADPFGTDGQLDEVLRRAARLCPALSDAQVVRRWAGLRPRPVGRDPMLGPLPGRPSIVALAGGYKISFGIAHRMAEAALAAIGAAEGPEIPPSFLPATHLDIAAPRGKA